jgi:hypothetical protein
MRQSTRSSCLPLRTPHRGVWTRFASPLAQAAAILALLGAAEARAGTIGFRTDAEVKSGPGIDAKVTMTHTGDEQAEEVSVVAELEGKKVEGETVPAIRPGEKHDWNFHLFDELARGIYVIVLRGRYLDGNGYPFEVISVANSTNGVTAGPRIFGSLEVPAMSAGGNGVASLVAKKPPGRTGEYEAELIVPAGVEVTPSTRVRLSFNSEGRATASFKLKNEKLLAGTTVNIFAFVRGTHEGFPQVDAIRGTARIVAAPARHGPPRFYETAAAVFVLLLVLEGIAWATGRRRELA